MVFERARLFGFRPIPYFRIKEKMEMKMKLDRSVRRNGKIGYRTGIIDRQVGSSCGSARRATATL